MTSLEIISSGLEVLEQAQINNSISSEQVAFCDAHDLIAIVNAGNNTESAITVYRLKGEVAFTIAERDDEELRPISLRWKPDGSLLAVNWSDDVCCLYSGENGKLLYELPTRRSAADDNAGWSLDVNAQDLRGDGSDEAVPVAEDGTVPAPIIWTSFDDGGSKNDTALQHNDDLTTEEFFDHMTNGGPVNDAHSSAQRSDSAISSLVNAITTLDTTAVLPRLSKVDTPTGMRFSPEGNKFSTQASTDTIFDASTFAPGIFSTLLTSDVNGCVTVFVDETIKVGHIQLSNAEHMKTASHSRCSSQVVLARSSEDEGNYALNFVDLPLERLGSPLNYVVSLNTRRLQSLMAYITHTIRCVHQEIQTGIKGVPARLMKLLEEDLRSASPDSTSSLSEGTDTATLELQHLALTSNFNPVVLEWLRDIVKETGHKRWDQAVNAMYDHITRYNFTNLLPALQRFVAAVSALRGQARFHQHTAKFDVRLGVFDQLIEWADVLGLVAQRTLGVVTEEHGQFKAFSKWLRVMIDVAVAGPGSKGADETEEREAPNVDMDLCLRYIRGPLMHSMLKVFAESNPIGGGQATGMSKAEFFGHPVVVSGSRERAIIALKFLDSPKQGKEQIKARSRDDTTQRSPSDPINLPLLTCLLKAHTRLAIDEVNTWQSQAVPRSPDVVPLEGQIEAWGMGRVWDIGLYPTHPGQTGDADNSAREIVHILGSPPSPEHEHENENEAGHGLEVLRVLRRKMEGKSAPPPPRTKVERIEMPTLQRDGAGLGRILHAALLNRYECLVLAQQVSDDDRGEPTGYVLVLVTFDVSSTSHVVLHSWSGNDTFLASPTHFVVGGRAGKRVVVVFSPAGPGGRGTRWEVLDLEGAGRASSQALEGAEGDVDME